MSYDKWVHKALPNYCQMDGKKYFNDTVLTKFCLNVYIMNLI